MSAVTLRPASSDDMARVFRWANDPATRAASFNSSEIPWADHQTWFADALQRDDRHLFIAMLPQPQTDAADASSTGSASSTSVDMKIAAGLVRLQADPTRPGLAEVGINVAPEARGHGVGRQALIALTSQARALGLAQLLASIRPSNPASIRAFEAVGYRRVADGEIDGQPALRFVLDLDRDAANPPAT